MTFQVKKGIEEGLKKAGDQAVGVKKSRSFIINFMASCRPPAAFFPSSFVSRRCRKLLFFQHFVQNERMMSENFDKVGRDS